MYQGERVSASMREEGIAELNFNAVNDSVNKFDRQTVQELAEAIEAIKNAPGVKGMLVTSGKPVFIVGADLMEIATLDSSGYAEAANANNLNNNTIEELPFPTVVAINGFALGGGFEFCLACDFRVMSTAAQVGLPEINLSLIPGWGGTVRLPRIIGFDNAVQWVAGARNHRPDAALKDHAVDAVVAPEQLDAESVAMLKRAIAGELDYQQRRKVKTGPLQLNQIELAMASNSCKGMIAQKAGKHYPAPLLAVDLMTKAAGMSRDDALAEETKAFAYIGQTPEARAMVGLFISDQFLGKTGKKLAKAATKKVGHATVLGAGIMGGGISYQHALKGFPVLMKDIAQPALDLGMGEANKLLSKRVEKGRLKPAKAGEMLTRITPTLNFGGVEQTDIVIEAVVENPKIKSIVLAEIEGLISDDTVLCSNTSSISINMLAENLQRPENFCGMHFFNPVHAMPLVEIIRGEKTSDATIGTAVAHVMKLGKKPVVVNNCPGFLVNRVLFPAFIGYDGLLAEGCDFQKADKALEKWGLPMGPAYLSDVVGIDTMVHALDVMAEGFPTRMNLQKDQSSVIAMFENNRYGQKNGVGYYSYEKDKRGRPKKVVNPEIYDLLPAKELKEFSQEEMCMRYLMPMATEMARCLDEGIVASPAEADMALIYGIGFPPFRGGIFRWLDEIGLDKFCEMAKAYEHLGEMFQPTERMKEMAANGATYY
jgi:3-hydroxyacyl-CoA dehydrogenase/enoyl-CoA hydratase/3-hydroxybutyryl-CoA epimerase/enoyl-CoA isomerase